MHNERPKVDANSSLRGIIMEMTSKRLGATAVVDAEGGLLGIITDGDLRRMLEKNEVPEAITASAIMTTSPKTIEADALAVEALDLMRAHDITQLRRNQRQKAYSGFIHLHDLIREGII